MQTSHISLEQMEQRVARFKSLQPLAIQQGNAVPLAARDVVYARKLLSVIGLMVASWALGEWLRQRKNK